MCKSKLIAIKYLLTNFLFSDKQIMLKKVLMCKPSFFRVDYQINPWMKPGSVNQVKALEQWQNLVDVYQKHGIDVTILDQKESFPDMVFAADQGLIIENLNKDKRSLILSNFRYPQRQGESQVYANWFKENNLQIKNLPEELFFEGGGELLYWKQKYFIGQGFRNSSNIANYLQQNFELDLISLDLINDKFYHLDTCMFVLNDETVFYYPPAFSEISIKKIKSLIKNPIQFTAEEVQNFAANSVLSQETVFVQAGSPSFVKKLEDLGYKIVQVDVSEFVKSGGGIHCLTFELQRLSY